MKIYYKHIQTYITNYRPISVLNFFSKIVEKIVANSIIDFLDQNDVFYDHQYGFRKCHSTYHAIITLVEKVVRVVDSGKIVVGYSEGFWCYFTPYTLKEIWQYI